MKEYSQEQLSEHDGRQDRPILVAVRGKVYDVSKSKRWVDGSHMKRHRAGQDLSEEIKAAPHGLEVLGRFEPVGNYRRPDPKARAGLKGKVESWLDQNPFFRRHPHPAVVHFPVGLLTVTPVLEAVGLLTQSPRTEWAAYCCLMIGLLSIPAAIATGYFTWWINYDATDSPILHKKRPLAWTALGLAIAAFAVRTFLVSDPLSPSDAWMIVYLLVMVLLTVVVSAVGFLGGRLTFPYE